MTDREALLLDTHIWVRHQVTPGLLRRGFEDRINEAAERSAVFVSVISVWELALLERLQRLELKGGVERWTREALEKPGLRLLPLSPPIAIESVNLPEKCIKILLIASWLRPHSSKA